MTKQFDIFNLQEPYGFYEEARRNMPIFWDEASGYWVVTRYTDVKEIMKNEAGFSARLDRVNYSDLAPEARATLCPVNFQKLYGLSTTENPSHDQVKKALMPVWNDLYSSTLLPQIEAAVKEYLAKVASKAEFDILAEVFNPLPAKIIFLILGIGDSDIPKVKEWSKSRLQLTWGDKSEQVGHAENIVKYWHFCEALIDQKMKQPGDDLPSKLLEVYYKDEISLREIKLLCYGLIFSGHTTTSAFMAEALKTLLQSGVWALHQEHEVPFSQSVEELLRLCPSAFTRRRIALSDFEVGNHQGKKGDELLLIIGSANRDESVFPEPNTIDIYRKNARNHLSLGSGFHYCIGSRLVKLEYTTIMKAIMETFPNIRLSDHNAFHYPENISIKALDALYVSTA